MLGITPSDSPAPRPSRVIAEALVKRHGPSRVIARAATLGCSPQLTQAMVAACCATAVDRAGTPKRRAIAQA